MQASATCRIRRKRNVDDASYGKTYLAKDILDIIADKEDWGL